MKIKFYYIRHGKTLFNKKGRMQGWCDSPLLPEGIRQAENVASALRHTAFDRAYTSSSERAWDTAKEIVKYHAIPLVLKKGLKEFSFGRLDGTQKEKVIGSPFSDDWSAVGGETSESFAQRVRSTLREIIAESNDGETVLLVGHGAYAVRLLPILFGVDLEEYAKKCEEQHRWLMPNTGIMIFHYCDGRFFLDQEPIDVDEYRQLYEPKTIDVYLMRHGETVFNVQGRVQGSCDSPLSANGIEQAKEAALHCKNIPFASIYVSTAERARNTAEIINHYHKKELCYSKYLCEVNYGDYEGMFFSEIEADDDRFYTTHYRDIGGEDFTDVTARLYAILHEVYDAHRDRDKVLLVSHGDFYFVCMQELFGIGRKELFEQQEHPAPNCGIAHFRIVDGRYELVKKMGDS